MLGRLRSCLITSRRAGGAACSGIFGLDFSTGSSTRLADPPYDPKLFRFNEGACDATGRFWVGVMFDPLEPGAEPQPESLHSFTLDGGLRHEPDAAELHNGMAWSPDGRTFYLSHSRQHEVFAFAFDEQRGALARAALLREDTAQLGGAGWGGGRCGRRLLVRAARGRPVAPLSPAGELAGGDRHARESTDASAHSAAEALETLYITSARDQIERRAARERAPRRGVPVLSVPAARGVPRRCTRAVT